MSFFGFFFFFKNINRSGKKKRKLESYNLFFKNYRDKDLGIKKKAAKLRRTSQLQE